MNRLASVVALASLSAACARTLVDSPASRTARYLASIRGQPSLQAPFLREMPKGGELHSHLAGAVYAENYLRWAMEDGFCVRRDTPALAEPPCDAARGDVLAAELSHDVSRQRALIDGWSMRSFANDWINLPNKDYWLAPDRRAETLGQLERQMEWMGAGTVAFFIFILQMTIEANLRGRPLDNRVFWTVFAGFMLLTVIWLVNIIRWSSRRPPQDRREFR